MNTSSLIFRFTGSSIECLILTFYLKKKLEGKKLCFEKKEFDLLFQLFESSRDLCLCIKTSSPLLAPAQILVATSTVPVICVRDMLGAPSSISVDYFVLWFIQGIPDSVHYLDFYKNTYEYQFY